MSVSGLETSPWMVSTLDLRDEGLGNSIAPAIIKPSWKFLSPVKDELIVGSDIQVI